MAKNLEKSGITGKIVSEKTIPAREYHALSVKKGQILRLIDVEGQQVPDLIAFNLNDFEEGISCYAMKLVFHERERNLHNIYSQKCNKMFTVIEDKAGMHLLGGYCNDYYNYARYGKKGTRNCRDNFIMAIAPYGLTGKDFNQDNCISFFMNVIQEPEGKTQILEPITKPGDYIDLKAEMDCLVAISACPQELNACNAFKPTPIKVVVYESP